MERLSVQSSSIASIGYDYEAACLEVRFLHGGVYRYFDVAPELYSAFLRADSKGAFFDERIRDAGYEFEKVG